MKILVALASILLLPAGLIAAEAEWDSAQPRRVVQPVQEYFASSVPYSHVASPYGTMGPGERELAWRGGAVCVERLAEAWAGMWHLLAGPSGPPAALDFEHVYPEWIAPRFQPACRAVMVRARGTGPFKVELKGPQDELLWSKQGKLAARDFKDFRLPCPTDRLRQVRTMSWVLDQGATACVDSLGIEIEYPEIPFSERVFLLSYAKLAHSYNPAWGTVRDKAHIPAGQQDSVPGSGLFCLATCAAWKLDMVPRDFAVQTLRAVHRRNESLPKSRGLLPHFIRRDDRPDAEYQISPGSEFSSVDTAIYYHSMLLAAQMLEDDETLAEITRAIESIEFDQLRNPDGFVLHGIRDDGTPLDSVWADWGGETALVLLLQAIAEPRAPQMMNKSGRVHQGVGFIAEIQSLFFPQFSLAKRDRVTGVHWKGYRRELFDRQRAYFGADTRTKTPAGELGVFGLSAGEGPRGEGYFANGVDQPGIQVIHPHYMLLGWEHWKEPPELYRVLRRMEAQGLLPPWGLVENLDADLTEYLPFNGSLNASFECLSAYHLWARANGQSDAIYEASGKCPPLRRALAIFYR